jgi:hypothetical protein
LAFCCSNNIDGGLVLKYFRTIYGPMGSGAKILEMRERLEQICEDGIAVAIQVMEDASSNAPGH